MAWKLVQKIVAGTAAEQISATSIKCAQAWVQAFIQNVGDVMVGDSNVTDAIGYKLITPVAGAVIDRVLLKPVGVGNNIDLSLVYVKGTAPGEGVTCLYEEF
jgi:hypothetical protein